MTDLINQHLEEINKICQLSGISYLALFGSQARKEARDDSDIDLLVEFKQTPGLIEFVKVKHQFENIFKRRVDLVTKKGLSKYIAPYIQKDLTILYG